MLPTKLSLLLIVKLCSIPHFSSSLQCLIEDSTRGMVEHVDECEQGASCVTMTALNDETYVYKVCFLNDFMFCKK